MVRLRNTFLAACCLLFGGALHADYESRLAAAQTHCEEVPAMKSHSGLWLNPEGYRSYYERSMCFQELALDFRQPRFCRLVHQRYSLFGSSWGYSEKNCSKLVQQARQQDEERLAQWRQAYRRDPVRLLGVTLRQDGNGRDFDLIPVFSAGFRFGYRFSAFLLDPSGARHEVVTQGFRLGGVEPTISLFVRRDVITRAVPTFSAAAPFTWVFELEVALPAGRGNALWPPGWLERSWPRAQRVQALKSRQAVSPWRPADIQ